MHSLNIFQKSESGQVLIAKIKDIGVRFNEDEVYVDFEKIYRKYVRLNKEKLGEFFILETKDILDKLYEDFEQTIA
jgi:type I restriction enzyme R subunit